jgi:hypothetical protein
MRTKLCLLLMTTVAASCYLSAAMALDQQPNKNDLATTVATMARYEPFVASAGSGMRGVAYCPEVSGAERMQVCVYQAYDSTGQPLWQVALQADDERDRTVYDPTFVVEPSGKIHVFWHSGSSCFYGAIVSPTGRIISNGKRIGAAGDHGRVWGIGGPFRAGIHGDKIIGVALGPVLPCGQGTARHFWIMMDLDHKIIGTKEHSAFTKDNMHLEVNESSAVRVDEDGKLRLAYLDYWAAQRRSEMVISYVCFDARGEIEEKQEVARFINPLDEPSVGMTADRQGMLHVYYTYRANIGRHAKDDVWALKHVQIKTKTPARGARSELFLRAVKSTFVVDTTGKERAVADAQLGRAVR